MTDDTRKSIENASRITNVFETIKAASIPPPKMPEIPKQLLQNHHINPAKWTHKRIAEYIQSFEEDLDDDHEIGARLVSFGQTIVFHIQDIGYYGPDIITFHGVNEQGERVQLIQNISQLSVLLVAMKKLGDKPKRIGFDLQRHDNEE